MNPRRLALAAAGALSALSLAVSVSAQTAPAAGTAAEQTPLRTWMSVNGNTLEGRFVKEEEGKVFILRPDGTTIATSRAKLSPNDLAWIDARNAPAAAAGKTQSFTKATQLETTKMEGYKKIRRLILRTYTQLTNNDREDKMLAFLERDALSMYGWQFISSDCYLTKSGKKGKLKELFFSPQAPVPLREAVQMVRDKFTLVMPDPVIVKEVAHDGETYWEVQNPPDYVARVLLMVDPETKDIKRFDLHFPPPEKP